MVCIITTLSQTCFPKHVCMLYIFLDQMVRCTFNLAFIWYRCSGVKSNCENTIETLLYKPQFFFFLSKLWLYVTFCQWQCSFVHSLSISLAPLWRGATAPQRLSPIAPRNCTDEGHCYPQAHQHGVCGANWKLPPLESSHKIIGYTLMEWILAVPCWRSVVCCWAMSAFKADSWQNKRNVTAAMKNVKHWVEWLLSTEWM